MPIQNDQWIREMAQNHGMIEPFEDGQVREGSISYGLSSYGYDIRVAPEFKVFTNVHNIVVDPKEFDDRSFVDVNEDVCIVPPNSFALARTIEYFRIPRDILVICLGKSTYARCGIIVNVTPLEPTWEGHLTLEISNTTPLPAKIYANEGISQLLFLKGNAPPGSGLRGPEGEVPGTAGRHAPEVVGGHPTVRPGSLRPGRSPSWGVFSLGGSLGRNAAAGSSFRSLRRLRRSDSL